ncbi:hypothetical protein [Streptomyces sp. cg36]|uniref:hypothetical protein n=1 Tax=Streptomyces sp. cg36 TaxID=3238798 RepID=UPI0034E1D231
MNGTDTFVRQVMASLARRRPFGETAPAAPAPAPHLLAEDRPAYERLVDDVLRERAPGPEEPFSTEQLRTMAMNAAGLINGAAAAEYLEYVRRREEGRRAFGAEDGADPDGGPAAPAADGDEEDGGAGPVAVVMVLAPVLAGAAAVGFLGLGYVLRLLRGDVDFARTLVTAGWVFGAITMAAILVSAVGLLLAAVRHGGQGGRGGDARAAGVAGAREAWLAALRGRGVEPFLREVRGPVAPGG